MDMTKLLTSYLLATMFIGINVVQAQPAVNPYKPGYAHPPYRLASEVPSILPAGYTAFMIKKAYGLYNTPLRGAGQTIGIVNAYDNPNVEYDLSIFNQAMNLVACTTQNGCFKKVYATGVKPLIDKGWAFEISLDVEWAHAIAPQAKILLVEAANNSLASLIQAIQVAIQNGATIIS